jgi:voltage-gated potassium channel
VMQSSYIIAREILALLTTPLLARFLKLVHHHSNDWANVLVSRIGAVTAETVPEIWVSELSPESAAAVYAALGEDRPVRLEHLLSDPRRRETRLACVALLLVRKGEEVPLPADALLLQRGDTLLFCGRAGASSGMAWTLQNHNALSYVETGHEKPDGTVWRWLEQHSRRRHPAAPTQMPDAATRADNGSAGREVD